MKNIELDRRDFIKSAVGFAALAAMPSAILAEEPEADSRRNIVLIMADDIGYECFGANGGTSYKTPILDKMAETGARFEYCYSQPVCTPSRVKIMTGIYNVRNYKCFGVMDRTQTTFAHLLKKAGYATCVAGKWQLGHEVDSPKHFGFDESCLWQHIRKRTDEEEHDTRYSNPKLEVNGEPVDYNNGEYGPDVVSDFACDFMGRNKDKPFLVYYPMILTHSPFCPTPDSKDWDPKSKGSKEYIGKPEYFGDMVTYMDKMVGKITAKLDELGLRDKTLVMFIGDNGCDRKIESMLNGQKVRGGKKGMGDNGTHTVFIAQCPGTVKEGIVSKDLVDFSDFLPTMCEATGTAVPVELNIDGRSFLSQLKGQKGNPRDWAYCYFKNQAWARTQRYKLYNNGKFCEVSNGKESVVADVDNPDEETKKVHAMLQAVHKRYYKAPRPERKK
ncbi:sulfatase-like hydrolase/transferase [Verrucomicrobiota bacterium]